MPKQLVLPGQKSAHIWLWSRWIEQSSAHLEKQFRLTLYCIALKNVNISPTAMIKVLPSAQNTIEVLLILNILTSLETTAVME